MGRGAAPVAPVLRHNVLARGPVAVHQGPHLAPHQVVHVQRHLARLRDRDLDPGPRIERIGVILQQCERPCGHVVAVNRDLIDLLAALNDQGVEYLIVGAHALATYGHVRATKDLEIWIRPDADNAPRIIDALIDFGAPFHDLTPADLTVPGLIFQIGVAPLRIDAITQIDGVEFAAAWPDRVVVDLDGVPVPVISRHHLIANKRASGRLQDLADVEWLEELGD